MMEVEVDEVPVEALRDWYVTALRDRIVQLDALVDRIDREGERAGGGQLERIARSLRSTGTSYGFPEVTAAAETVERAASRSPARLAEALARTLRPIAWPDDREEGSRHHWLARALPTEDRSTVLRQDDSVSAWEAAVRVFGDPDRLVAELARRLGLGDPMARPGPAPLPPTIPLAGTGLGEDPLDRWVCFRAEDEVVHVAATCPVALEVERMIEASSGRRVSWWIVSPGELDRMTSSTREPESAFSEPVAVSMHPAGQLREGAILVVDDDPDARLLVRTVLERGSLAVEEFETGRAALSRFDSSGASAVALLIVDLQMPEIHGAEVVREVRARGFNLPVLVLTGDEHPGTEVELLEAGATDFLRKPVSPPVLAARVQALLRR